MPDMSIGHDKEKIEAIFKELDLDTEEKRQSYLQFNDKETGESLQDRLITTPHTTEIH